MNQIANINKNINNNMNKNNSENKRILKLFPYLKDTVKANQLKIDDDSIHYISVRDVAELITKIIEKHLLKLNINIKETIITDATSGVGGNTLSFAKSFKYVNAIEIDNTRCKYLKNNIDIYDIKNVNVFKEDCTKILNSFEDQDVVFIDPPWGGKLYKKIKSIRCMIADMPIEIICNNLMDNSKTNNSPKLIVFKLPKNYDLDYLIKYINSDKIFMHSLKKMIIIVVYNQN